MTTHNTHNRQTTMPHVGFEPAISIGERTQTYLLDRAATATGMLFFSFLFLFSCFFFYTGLLVRFHFSPFLILKSFCISVFHSYLIFLCLFLISCINFRVFSLQKLRLSLCSTKIKIKNPRKGNINCFLIEHNAFRWRNSRFWR